MKNNTVKIIRYIILAIFLVIVTVKAYMHQALGGGVEPSIHAICPYGGLESLFQILFTGTLIQKIFTGTFVLLGITILIAIVFRRSFCGLICPLGTLQEFFGIFGRRIFGKRFVIPEKIDKPLRYLKYVVLIVTIFFTWKTATLWVNPYDPWAAYAHITEGFEVLTGEYAIGFMILILILVGSMFYDRFFCKYLCPMGAFYAILSKFSLSKISRNSDKCISCGLCDKACPVNIKVSCAKDITSAECISCTSCTLACPKEGALEIKTANKTIKPIVIILIVISIFVGTILTLKLSGNLELTPKKVTASTVLKVEEIKGYMTLEEISVAFKIELPELYKKLGLKEDIDKNTKLKDLKNIVEGFEVEKVRELLK